VAAPVEELAAAPEYAKLALGSVRFDLTHGYVEEAREATLKEVRRRAVERMREYRNMLVAALRHARHRNLAVRRQRQRHLHCQSRLRRLVR
jgi:hypothetical protein